MTKRHLSPGAEAEEISVKIEEMIGRAPTEDEPDEDLDEDDDEDVDEDDDEDDDDVEADEDEVSNEIEAAFVRWGVDPEEYFETGA